MVGRKSYTIFYKYLWVIHSQIPRSLLTSYQSTALSRNSTTSTKKRRQSVIIFFFSEQHFRIFQRNWTSFLQIFPEWFSSTTGSLQELLQRKMLLCLDYKINSLLNEDQNFFLANLSLMLSLMHHTVSKNHVFLIKLTSWMNENLPFLLNIYGYSSSQSVPLTSAARKSCVFAEASISLSCFKRIWEQSMILLLSFVMQFAFVFCIWSSSHTELLHWKWLVHLIAEVVINDSVQWL